MEAEKSEKINNDLKECELALSGKTSSIGFNRDEADHAKEIRRKLDQEKYEDKLPDHLKGSDSKT